MRNTLKKGFTLIELLVVITIIGILATGGVNIFTKQLQGARDATRINDVKLLETAINLHYSDEEEYPDPATFSGAVADYMSKTVKDPKADKPVCWRYNLTPEIKNDQNCGGVYVIANDKFGLENSAYKLSIYFEKETNLKNKAKNTGKDGDGGTNDSMYELFAGAGANTLSVKTTKDDVNDITVTGLSNTSNSRVY